MGSQFDMWAKDREVDTLIKNVDLKKREEDKVIQIPFIRPIAR
jgi:hypothetical protein